MTARLHWVDLPESGRLAIMARPRAGDWLDDEIAAWRSAGLTIVASLLEAHEVGELGLQREAEICRVHGIEFLSFPIPDRGVPASAASLARLVDRLAEAVARQAAVAVHCRAGIGRSALVAACVLGRLGIEEAVAFERLSRARGVAVPDTGAQRDWVHAFARRDRAGALEKRAGPQGHDDQFLRDGCPDC